MCCINSDSGSKNSPKLSGAGGLQGLALQRLILAGSSSMVGNVFPEEKASFLPSSAVADIQPPPILFRYPFPELPLLIVMPNCSRIYGDTEVELFRTLCPQPVWVAQKLSHNLTAPGTSFPHWKMICPNFGKALNNIQTFGWKRVEIEAQGAELQLTLDYLRDTDAFGAGVSSWGPAICVIAEDIDRLKQETDTFLKTLPDGGTCFITQANNLGASVGSG